MTAVGLAYPEFHGLFLFAGAPRNRDDRVPELSGVLDAQVTKSADPDIKIGKPERHRQALKISNIWALNTVLL